MNDAVSEALSKTNFGAILRGVGFANAPGLLQLFGVLTPIRELAFFVAGMWSLVAMITAVRHALSYSSSWRALGVCTIPLLGRLLLYAFALAMFGPQGLDRGYAVWVGVHASQHAHRTAGRPPM